MGGRLAAILAVRYFDLLLLAAALPVFIAADLPITGYAVVAAVWLRLARRRGLHRAPRGPRAEAGQPARRDGLDRGHHAGRVWLLALAVLLVGLLDEREAGLAAALLSAVLFTVHFAGRFIARAMTPPEERHLMSRKAKVLLGFGIYFAVIVAVLLIFGNDGKNESFQPQNEFKLEPWVHIKIAGIDMSINKAVLYLVLASGLTLRHDGLDRAAHGRRSRTGRRPRSSSPTT